MRVSLPSRKLIVMAEVVVNEARSSLGTQEWREDPRWQLVQRIVGSSQMAKSPRLCAFLQFVTAETLRGRAADLNEQRIGIHVFQRKSDYNSSDDNIVRSHASRLRQRLAAYFLQEGQEEVLRVSLPRGSYVPVFEMTQSPNVCDPEGASQVAPQAPIVISEGRWERKVIFTLAVLLLVATTLASWGLYERAKLLSSSHTSAPVHRALWGEIFVAGKQTYLVPADSSLVIYENLTGDAVSLPAYMDKSYLSGDTLVPADTPVGIAKRFAHRRLTSIADLETVTRLLQVPEAVKAPPVLRFARDVQIDDLKGSDAILIGAKESNPWLALFDTRRNFVIDDDQRTRRFTVVNRSPQRGEEANYFSQADDPQHRAYGAIALLPNLDDSGHVLIIEGTSIAGTEAATEFVLGNSQIENLLLPVLRRTGRIPSFEMLLETTNLNGNSPRSRVVAVRIKD